MEQSQVPAPGADPGVRVLIVEDSPVDAIAIGAILKMAGYAVERAVDGLDGLERARRSAPALIISDINMPRLNGFGLCHEIRSDERTASIPIILLTSRDSPRDVITGIAQRADDFLTKPIDPVRVRESVAELLRKSFEDDESDGWGFYVTWNGRNIWISARSRRMLEALLESADSLSHAVVHLESSRSALQALVATLQTSRPAGSG